MTNRRGFLAASAAFTTLSLTMPALAGSSKAGTFIGKSNHVTSGQVKLLKEGGKFYVELQPDFEFDGAPDPKVALGHNGYDSAAQLGALHKNSGAQRYEVPTRLSADDFNEVWIWCEKFSVPLGMATLN